MLINISILFILSACGGSVDGEYLNSKPRALSFSDVLNTSPINLANEGGFLIEGTCEVSGSTVDIQAASVTDTVICSELGVWSTTLDLSNEGDGNILVSVSETKSSGVVKSKTVVVEKDTVAPASVDSATIPQTTIIASDDISAFIISGNCSETNGTLKIKDGGSQLASGTCDGSTYSIPVNLSSVAQGTVSLDIILSDDAGNERTNSVSIDKDTIIPTVSVSAPVGTKTNSASILVTFEFSEDIAGFGEGDIVLSNATVDPGSLVAVDGDTYTVSIIPTSEGSMSVELGAGVLADLLGNGNDSSNTINSIYDSIPASSTGLANDAVPTELKTWNWGCSDTSTCTYRYIIDTNPTTNPTGAFDSTVSATQGGIGNYYLHLQIMDDAGNISSTEHFSAVLQDTTNPVVTGLSDDAILTNSKTHTWGCVDASTCQYRYVVDQSPTTNPGTAYGATTTITTTSGDGTYYLHIQARDVALNESAVVHVQFEMDTVDPVLTGVSNDATIAKTKTWNWGCTDTNSCTYRYTIDQSPATTPSGSFDGTVTASQLTGDGDYYLHLEVQDTGGNTTLGHYSVTLDNTNPFITGLSNDATIAQSKTWTWGCTDASACTYQYTIDQSAGTVPAGGFSATTTDTQASGDGVYYLHIEAQDVAGNSSSVGHFSVTLDNTAPVITGLSNDNTPTASKTWTWGCTDASTCTYRYEVDRVSGTNPTGSYSATTTTTYNTGLGYFYLHIQATDAAGNTSSVSEYYALLNASVLAGSDVQKDTMYTGDGTASRAVASVGYQPDLVWIKNRDSASDNMIFTSARGAGNYVTTNTFNAESTDMTTLSSFDSTGFTLGSSTEVNASGDDFMSWAFKENANFMDIVSYTGNSSDPRAIGHSLGTVPGLMMIKNVSNNDDWVIYQKDMNSGEAEPATWGVNSATRWIMNLNTDDSVTHVSGSYFANIDPTSTQFTLGSHSAVNSNTDNFIAILFASSTTNIVRTGTYTGNGSVTGPMVTLGYEPKWVMIKRKDSAGDWEILDSSRSPANIRDDELKANLSDAEAVNGGVDFDPTGFQVRTTNADYNASGGRYIYLVIGN